MFKHISDRYCCVEIDAAGNTKISHHGSLPRTSSGFVRYDRSLHGNACYYHRLCVHDRKTGSSFIVLFTGLPESAEPIPDGDGVVARLQKFS